MSSPRRNASRRLRLAGHVGEDPELDLRVVGRQQAMPRLGDERGADLPAELRPDRDRLEIGIRGRQPAGRGDRLVDRRMQAAVRPEQRGQRLEIRVEQLRELAPLLDDRDDLVVAPDRPQHLAVRRVPGLPLATGRQLELLEQDAAQLHGRADDELLAGELVRPCLELLDPVAKPCRDLTHAVRVDADAGVSIAASTSVRGSSTSSYSRSRPRSRTRSRRSGASRRAASARRTSAAVSSSVGGSGSSSRPCSAARSSRRYSARPGSIRYAAIIVSSAASTRSALASWTASLAFVACDSRVAWPRRDDDLVSRRHGDAFGVCGEADLPGQRRQLALAPRNRLRLELRTLCCR